MRLLITGGNGFIGANMIQHFAKSAQPLLTLDLQPPPVEAHLPYWKQCDLLDGATVNTLFESFQPTHVIHLAARTDMKGKTLDDYRANTDGTANVLDAVKKCPNVERLIVTSTQFVHRPGPLPEHDEDYDPHTLYGESKVVTEKLTRAADLPCTWVIVRPTNIWGPWHPRYPKEFWLVLAQGRYLHPAGESVIRSYGYVKNVVHQYEQILCSPEQLVNRQTYYLGDGDMELYDWANGFSLAITGKKVRTVPKQILRTIAALGDGINRLGGNFPLFTSRYQSMTSSYVTPVNKTLEVFGPPQYTLQQGIDETVTWLRSEKLI